MAPFPNIFDQVVLTEFIKREYEELIKQAGGGEDRDTNPAEAILGTTPVNTRVTKLKVQDIVPVGLAQFKAPGATPALWSHKPNLREMAIELVDVDEFHRIDPVDMLKLESNDPMTMQEGLWTLTDRATAMATRNDQRVEWMRWEALKGTLVIPFPNAAPLSIGYGIPAGNFPTIGTAWTNHTTSNPITDLWAISAAAIPASGIYVNHFHMGDDTFRHMQLNDKLIAQLSTYGRSVMQPQERDVIDLLRPGAKISLINSGYLPENSTDKTLTRWIDEGKIFATTSNYRYAGRKIGDVADGWVLVGQEGRERPVGKQGMQSEWVYNRIGQETLYRQARSVIPRIDAPEVLVWATAYTP